MSETSDDDRVSAHGDSPEHAEAEKQLRRFEGHNLRIGPKRKVHRVKVGIKNGLKLPTPVCGQHVSRYPLFDCEAVITRADCRKCQELCNTGDPCAEFPEGNHGQLALFDV